MAQDHAHRTLNPGLEAGELKDLKEAHWSQVLESALQRAGKTARAVADSPGNAPWKIALARRLRREGAGYAWITAALRMGKPSSARAYLCQVER